MKKEQQLVNSVRGRLARARQTRTIRILGGRGAVTLLLGTALSLGGLTDAINGAHFLVEKNLDAVRVVHQDQRGGKKHVIASVEDGFAANSLFKLSQILPDRYVSRELTLFNEEWLRELPDLARQKQRDVFQEEMKRLNAKIRNEFFVNAVPFGDLIAEKSAKYDVDPALVAAVIEAESRFRTKARSPVGAAGLMQLMPRTGRWMGARNLYDPEQNVDAGVKYIKYLQHRFDGDLKNTIAAYNAGEGNVQRYGGVPPFGETQTYVKRVMRNYKKRNEELRKYGEEQARAGGSSPDIDGAVAVK